jgi:ribonuclease-3
MAVEQNLGYFFFDKTILQCALTRPSFAADQAQDRGLISDQTAYRVLGASILQMVLTELLIRMGYADESDIHTQLASLQNVRYLGFLGDRLEVYWAVKLGTVEQDLTEEPRLLLCTETLLALLGGIYMDGGFRMVREIICHLFRDVFPNDDPDEMG